MIEKLAAFPNYTSLRAKHGDLAQLSLRAKCDNPIGII